MKAANTAIWILSTSSLTAGMASGGRPGYGLIGYGITMYEPRCAYTCQATIPQMLDCPGDDHSVMDMDGMGMEGMDMTPSPECLATNPPYLRSLAWCIHSHCGDSVANLPALEEWWVLNVAVRLVDQPVPNISYQSAVEQVKSPPTDVLGSDEVMNRTVMADEDTYIANDNIYIVFEEQETNHSTTSMVVFITGAVIPILLSLLRFIPFPPAAVSKFNAFFIDPPVMGTRHAEPIRGLATVPTRGQAIFIAYLISINIICCAVGIRIMEPQTWFPTSWYQVAAYVSNRTGAISFANIPLLILYSSRNNVLLWLTDWHHNTFLLLHRYIAWMCTIEACIHSAIYLRLYLWKQEYGTESQLPYWVWGIVGTMALSILLPLSIRPIRASVYEFFRVSHIILAIIAIVGSWYHIIERYDHQWGYETWLYMAMAVWAVDRLVRLVRIASHGVRRAYVHRIDEDYVRVDIPGIQCDGHVYAYFPTLSWRVWENHPFSAVSSIGTRSCDVDSDSPITIDKSGALSSVQPNHSKTVTRPGISLFIRTHSGGTGLLASKVNDPNGIPILVEASYQHDVPNVLVNAIPIQTPEFPNTILIAGGVGITAIFPYITRTMRPFMPIGTTKVFWGVRGPAIVDSIEDLIADVKVDDMTGLKTWAGGIEAHTSVGERLNLRKTLEDELSSGKGTTVVVSGPEEMADDVRNTVSALGRNGAIVRLIEESFTW